MAKKKNVKKPQEMTKRQLSRHQKARRRQRLIFMSGIGVIVAVVVILVVGLVIGEVMPNHKTVLKVNDREFTYGYYVKALELYVAASPGTSPSLLNSQLLSAIKQNEIIRQAAAELGIVIPDEDVKARLKELGMDKSEPAVDLIRAEMLREKLLDEHFSEQVPETMPQVKMDAMLVESVTRAAEVRELVIASEDFQALAREYGLNYYSQNEYFGQFDWHPRDVYINLLSSEVPVDYAFSASPGDVSDPLPDAEISKKLGYWVIRVNEHTFEPGNEEEGIPDVTTADVTALLLSSEEEALEIKQRLENGEDVATLVEEYSQHSASKEKGGEMGVLTKPQEEGSYAVSESFDEYVFNQDIETGIWSDPIKDTNFYTKGGAWLVRVVDRDDNRELSEEDRDTLIQKKYSEWITEITGDSEKFVVEELLTPEQQSAALEAVS